MSGGVKSRWEKERCEGARRVGVLCFIRGLRGLTTGATFLQRPEGKYRNELCMDQGKGTPCRGSKYEDLEEAGTQSAPGSESERSRGGRESGLIGPKRRVKPRRGMTWLTVKIPSGCSGGNSL